MEELSPVYFHCGWCQREAEATRAQRRHIKRGQQPFCSMHCRSAYFSVHRRCQRRDKDGVNWEAIFAKHVDPHYYDHCKYGQEWKGRFQHA